jgi:hypothetical protein
VRFGYLPAAPHLAPRRPRALLIDRILNLATLVFVLYVHASTSAAGDACSQATLVAICFVNVRQVAAGHITGIVYFGYMVSWEFLVLVLIRAPLLAALRALATVTPRARRARTLAYFAAMDHLFDVKPDATRTGLFRSFFAVGWLYIVVHVELTLARNARLNGLQFDTSLGFGQVCTKFAFWCRPRRYYL